MLSKNKLLEENNNTSIGRMAAAAREARLEYLNKAAVLNQVAPATNPIGHDSANSNPKKVATPLPPRNFNQIG